MSTPEAKNQVANLSPEQKLVLDKLHQVLPEKELEGLRRQYHTDRLSVILQNKGIQDEFVQKLIKVNGLPPGLASDPKKLGQILSDAIQLQEYIDGRAEATKGRQELGKELEQFAKEHPAESKGIWGWIKNHAKQHWWKYLLGAAIIGAGVLWWKWPAIVAALKAAGLIHVQNVMDQGAAAAAVQSPAIVPAEAATPSLISRGMTQIGHAYGAVPQYANDFMNKAAEYMAESKKFGDQIPAWLETIKPETGSDALNLLPTTSRK